MFPLVCAAALVSVLLAPPVFAAGNRGHVKVVDDRAHTHLEQTPLSAKKGKKKAKKPAASPVQYTPGGESVPTRERRLRRECKGRPNAGACLGYAS